MKVVKQIKKSKRKVGKIYTNTDELCYPLTYSISIKLIDGSIYEMERNTRRALKPFLKKKGGNK